MGLIFGLALLLLVGLGCSGAQRQPGPAGPPGEPGPQGPAGAAGQARAAGQQVATGIECQVGEARYSANPGPTVISNVRVIDGLGNPPLENQDIVLANGKIDAIGPAGTLKLPAGALQIDGAGMTAMP